MGLPDKRQEEGCPTCAVNQVRRDRQVLCSERNAVLAPQKSALVEALAFKLRVLLDAEDTAADISQSAEQADTAVRAAADASPSAEQAEDSLAAEAAPAVEAASALAEDGTAAAGTAGPPASRIEEAYRHAQSLCGIPQCSPGTLIRVVNASQRKQNSCAIALSLPQR